MTVKIYLVKYEYADQYTHDSAVVGVYTDLGLAKAHRDSGGGYLAIYKAEANKPLPNQLERIL